MDHVALTLDGAVDDRPDSMRWMPPEKAAAIRAEQAATELRRTIELAAHVRQALAEQARP